MDNKKKRIVFITGTRADYGKMKSLMQILDKDEQFEVFIFVCGMHLLKTFGNTYEEIVKDGYTNIHVAYGLLQSTDTSINLGNTIAYLSGFVYSIVPDMIIVHGDRADALAGAVVGAFHNIIVGHIEGGELSGTVDESIRHAISKFAHAHFVCMEEAKARLIQLGEEEERIYVIGSPDVDIMLSDDLPGLQEARKRYEIPFAEYGILMYHPVTTEYALLGKKVKSVVDAVIDSGENYIVIYPNNDLGSEIILNEYRRLNDKERFKVFPSLRFEYFLTLLKYAKFIIGNSSAGIRESGIYGIPAIDIGTRQNERYDAEVMKNIMHTKEDRDSILEAIRSIGFHAVKTQVFGDGNSTMRFYEIVKNDTFWKMEIQKKFVDFHE